ncbi:MAG: winged helix-turn-helix domain-containing protein [[Clostridium] innocuum]
MHISNLRRKLREVNDQDYIEAVWGIGFKLKKVVNLRFLYGFLYHFLYLFLLEYTVS